MVIIDINDTINAFKADIDLTIEYLNNDKITLKRYKLILETLFNQIVEFECLISSLYGFNKIDFKTYINTNEKIREIKNLIIERNC